MSERAELAVNYAKNGFRIVMLHGINKKGHCTCKQGANCASSGKHPIYKGHFEQIPITPGVCQVQLVKELLQSNFGQKLILERADSIKYLGMINPETQAELSVQLNVSPSDDALSVTASISSETAVFMKFKGSFKRL